MLSVDLPGQCLRSVAFKPFRLIVSNTWSIQYLPLRCFSTTLWIFPIPVHIIFDLIKWTNHVLKPVHLLNRFPSRFIVRESRTLVIRLCADAIRELFAGRGYWGNGYPVEGKVSVVVMAMRSTRDKSYRIVERLHKFIKIIWENSQYSTRKKVEKKNNPVRVLCNSWDQERLKLGSESWSSINLSSYFFYQSLLCINILFFVFVKHHSTTLKQANFNIHSS